MGKSDGEITILTSLDTKDFDNQLKELEKKAEKYNKKIEEYTTKTSVKYGADKQALTSGEYEEYSKIQTQILEIKKQKLGLQEIEKKINAEIQEQDGLNTKNNYQIKKLRDELQNLIYLYNEMQKQDIMSESDQEKAKELKEEIINIRKELEKISGEKIHIKGIDNIEPQLNKINFSITKIIKNVGKWALAIFSVRSAYMFVRQAVSTLSQYNSQLATDLEYIRWSLANALAPVINYIINLVRTLLTYVNYISLKWFGKELFASAKDFENVQKSSKQTVKNVKEIKKQLSGFDEMEILQEQNTSSSSNNDLGINIPSFDLKNYKDIPIPKWVQWIADNKDIFKIIGEGLAILFGAGLAKKIATILGAGGTTGLSGVANLLNTIGKLAFITISILIIVDSIKKLIELEKEIDEVNKKYQETSEQKDLLIKNQKEISKSIGNLMEDENKSIESKKAVISTTKEQIRLTQEEMNENDRLAKNVGFLEGLFTDNAYNYRQNVLKNLQVRDEEINTLYEAAKAYEFNDEKMGEVGFSIYDLVKAFTSQQENIKNNIKYLDQNSKEYESASKKIQDYDQKIFELKNKMLEELNALKLSNDGLDKNSEQYKKNTQRIDELKQQLMDITGINPNVKLTIDADTSKAEKKTGNFFSNLGESVSAVAESGLGLLSGKTTNLFGKLKSIWKGFKFAKGGIISLPGRGVPLGYGQAIGGEAGREGVIPLTDSQQMQLLGEAIGKYININLTNITKLDNRQIAREQKIINNRNEFVSNS